MVRAKGSGHLSRLNFNNILLKHVIVYIYSVNFDILNVDNIIYAKYIIVTFYSFNLHVFDINSIICIKHFVVIFYSVNFDVFNADNIYYFIFIAISGLSTATIDSQSD